jgi:Na+-driven multidrug efflux pump
MLKEGWPVFLSNISTSFYTTINIILLKLFAGADQVAYFAATDKIRVAAQGFIQPIAAALFPRIAALHKESNKSEESRSLIRRGSCILLGVQLAEVCPVLFCRCHCIALPWRKFCSGSNVSEGACFSAAGDWLCDDYFSVAFSCCW